MFSLYPLQNLWSASRELLKRKEDPDLPYITHIFLQRNFVILMKENM